MGNNASCGNLHEYSNACEIHKCVQNVQGIPSNSASPTDTWIVEFNPGTNYEGRPIEAGFLKWFINSYSLPEPVNRLQEEYIKTLQGLNYEVRIYRDIIRPLIDYNICPNFVRYLASSKRCNWEQMVAMLSKTMSTEDAEYVLNRNLAYMSNNFLMRPSINNISVGKPKLVKIYTVEGDKLKYNFLINEPVKKGTLTLQEWLKQYQPDTNELFQVHTWRVIFQVMAGCYAMSLCRMTHNDFHLNNIWVEKLHEPHKVYYRFDSGVYSFDTEFKVMIYDFDRSYVERFGDNRILINNDSKQTNEFVPNKDMVKFFAHLIKYTTNVNNHVQILDILGHDYKNVKFLHQLYGYTLGSHLNKLYSPLEIVDNVGKLIGGTRKEEGPFDLTTHIFTCTSDMFDNNGKIIKRTMTTDNELTRCKAQLDEYARKHDILSKQIQSLIYENEQLREKYKFDKW